MQEGQINHSILVMREELIKRKKEKERFGRIGSVGMLIGIIPLGRVFFMTNSDMYSLFNVLTSPLVIMGIFIVALSAGYYKVYYQKAKSKYDSLREELMSKIWNDFCNCWSACSHKEEFLQETKEKYGINLYWK